ncbi:MAG: DUF748 domain-containing protein [Steroidobacteraceae bacterium]
MESALHSRWVRRGIYAAVVAAVVVGLYAIAGFVVVPRVLRSELTTFVFTHYHRQLTLDDVRFNPFTLTLDTGAISFPDTDAAPMLSVAGLHVELQLASLWRRGASFGEIILDRPFARIVIRRDGSVNLADLEKPFAQAPRPKLSTPSAPMRLFIDQFAVVQGRTIYEDDSRSKPFSAQLEPVSFSLSNFRTVGAAADRYALDFATTLGAHFHASGTLALQPLASSGTFALSGLRAATLRAYLGKALNFDVPSGLIALNGDYSLAPAGPPTSAASAPPTPASAPAGAAGASTDIKIDLQRLTVSHLGVRPPGAQSDVAELGLLDVRGVHVDLARRSLAVDSITLTGGSLQASVETGGTLNLMQLMAGSSPSTTAPPSSGSVAAGTAASATATGASTTDAAMANVAPASAARGSTASSAAATGWTIAAPSVAVSDFKVLAEDREVSPPAALTLDHIELRVQDFRSPSDAPLKISAAALVGSTGKLAAGATYDLGSGAASARIAVTRLDLTPLQPFLAAHSALKLRSGWLTTKLEVRRTAKGVLTVSGNTEVAKFRTVDDLLGNDFVKWTRLSVEGMSYRSKPASLVIRRIVAVAPYARVTVTPQRKLSLFEAFTAARPTTAAESATSDGSAPPAPSAADVRPERRRGDGGDAATPQVAAAAKGPAAQAAASMSIAIRRVRVVDASAHYTDLWIVPHFFLAIQKLSGEVTGLSSKPRSRATVSLAGKVDEYAPISISGSVNLLAANRYSDMKMAFKGVQLTTATPYSARFAGYKIEKGTMSADITYRLENGELSADPHFIIDQLELGAKVTSPDAIHLPLKLAVALLKDRHGVIDLDLPISGSMSDPKFRLGPLIWKAVVNLLAKAATAPFALLGRLVGGGEQLKYVDFDAGSAALDASARKGLAALAQALEDRPSLKLDVPSAYTPALDRPALARQTLEQQLVALSRQESEPHGRRRAARGHASNGGSAVISPELSNPAARFRLLIADYRSQLGAKAALPPEALAILKIKSRKKKAAVPLGPAISALESALLTHIQVPEQQLERLGRRRARAIQGALLRGTKIAPARLFVLNTATTKADGARVRFSLGLE